MSEMPRPDDARPCHAGTYQFDLRTFECVKCDHVEKVLVATDPIRSFDTLGWLLGELRPPT